MTFSPQPERVDRLPSIARLLGLGGEMRCQNPKLQKTTGRRSRWYIRPYVPVLTNAGVTPKQKRFFLGVCDETTKRQATLEKNRILEKINRHQWMVAAQIPFKEFIDEWLKLYVRPEGNLSLATQEKYESHVDSRIRPVFGNLMVGDITTKSIDEWLAGMATQGLSYNTRKDLRNTLSGIFTKARKWGLWEGANPAADATVGKLRYKRDKRKLSIEQMQNLLAAVPEAVALMCKVALLTLRVSEVLALQEKHLDFITGRILVRQRYYLGDIDVCKSRKSVRDVPMGVLAEELKGACTGDPERFVFDGWTYNKAAFYLREAAVKLGCYWEGFGFHQWRREAKTGIGGAGLEPFQLMRLSGHTKADESLLYTLSDSDDQEAAVLKFQRKVLVN